MVTSLRWFLPALLFSFLSPTTQAKPWPSSKFEIPTMSNSFYSLGRSYIQELRPYSFKVLVWNMLKGKRSKWRDDILTLAGDKDILMLQEAYLNTNMINSLNKIFDAEFFIGVSFLYKKRNDTATGTVLGSKVTPIHSYMMRSTDLEPIINTPKTMTAAILPFYGKRKRLLVLNIHGLNLVNHSSFINHISQALEKIKLHDGPVLYAGDFNTWTRKRTAHLQSVLNALGLSEVKWKNDRRKSWMGYPLDHAYVRHLNVLKAEVLSAITSSDHKPLDLQLSYVGP